MNANETSPVLAAGVLFLIAFILAFIAGMLYMGRNQLRWAAAQSSRRYLYWERSLWIAGIILLALGFSLFAEMLQTAGENILSRLGLTAFLFGAVLLVVAEVSSLETQVWASYMVRLSVILLLLAEAAFGGAILQIGQLPQWVGWATIIWGAGWLAVLFRAKDPYYPILFYTMPFIIGLFLINLTK